MGVQGGHELRADAHPARRRADANAVHPQSVGRRVNDALPQPEPQPAPQTTARAELPPPDALELPRPDEALLYLEDAATLAFFTDSAPEEMKTLYSDLLTAEGWTPGENRKETIEGTNMDVLPFSRGEEQLEMGIAVTDAGTLVVFTLPPEE